MPKTKVNILHLIRGYEFEDWLLSTGCDSLGQNTNRTLPTDYSYKRPSFSEPVFDFDNPLKYELNPCIAWVF